MSESDDIQVLIEVPRPVSTRCNRFKEILKNVTVEPSIFFFVLGMNLPEIPLNNFFIYKVCKWKRFNETICDNLLTNKSEHIEKIIVQQSMFQWKMLIEVALGVPIVFLAMVLGPWSDKYGRKIPMAVPIIGRLISTILFTLNVYYKEIHIIYLIIAYLPSSIFASYLVSLIAYSYISDVTNKENRTVRLAIFSAFVYSGEPIAFVCGTRLYDSLGFYPILGASMFFLVLSFILVLTTVKETIRSEDTYKQKFRYFFRLSIMKQCFRSVMKKRNGFSRLYLCIYVIVYALYTLYRVADWQISYMFTQITFDWSLNQYTIFSTVRSVAGLIVLVCFAPLLSKVYRIKDHTFVIIGVVAAIVCYLIFGMCQAASIFYLGALLGSFIQLVSLGAYSAVSKLVESNEQGTIYASMVTTEKIIPIFGTAIQLQIYTKTLDFYPGLVYCVNSFLMLIPLILALWIKKNSQRQMVHVSTQM